MSEELREYCDEDLDETLAEIEAEPVKSEELKKALPERTLLVITKAHEELRAITLDQVLYALYPDDDDSLCLRCKYIISNIFEEAEEAIAKSKQQPSEVATPKKRPMLPSRREKYKKEREEMKKKREEAKLKVLEYMDTCKPLEEGNHHNTVPCDKMYVPVSPRALRKFWAKFLLETIKEEDVMDTQGYKVKKPCTRIEDSNIPIVDDSMEENQDNKRNFFTRKLQRSSFMKALRKKKGKKVLFNATLTQSEC